MTASYKTQPPGPEEIALRAWPANERRRSVRIVVEWWERHYNLSVLYGWLVDNDRLDWDSEAVVAFLDKPWHWTAEWEECRTDMAQRGTPVDRKDDGGL